MSKGAAAAFDEAVEAEEAAVDTSPDARAAARLVSLIERVERIEEEMGALRADRSDIIAEAKAAGYDVRVMKAIIKRRKLERATVEELDTLLDLYERAIGQ